MERGVKIGADVPYCIMRGTALAEGIGEILSPLPPMPACKVLLAKPPVSVSTKFVYENLKLDQDSVHPDIDLLMEGLEERNLQKVASNMGNILESVTIPCYPQIAAIRETMLQQGALNAMMSGSGPTVFGLFEDSDRAQEAYNSLKAGNLVKQVFLTDIFQTDRSAPSASYHRKNSGRRPKRGS